MRQKSAQLRDPLGLSLACAAAFTILVMIRFQLPTAPYFDEVHYLPAAREWLGQGQFLNQEHPPLGKQLIALAIAVFGDNPTGWRTLPLVAGIVALFASMRAMWFATQSRFASVAFGLLLASGFVLFIHARIAMLDIFAIAFLAVAAWQFSAAIWQPEKARMRLMATGIALGLAMASKWNAAPIAMLPGLAFLLARIAAGRRRPLASQRGLPIPGISLLEATLWLGAVPLIVYAMTFAPAAGLRENPFLDGGLIALHQTMFELQTQVLKPHPYQSNWPDWVFNLRAIWYLYEHVDGAQRGIMLIGNPLTMLLGLPALLWCLITGVAQRNWARLAMVIGYVVSLSLWVFADKSVQFYYHYLLPSIFLLGALTLALDALWNRGQRLWAGGVIVASCALFAWFYPILSAAPLDGPNAFLTWTWLDSWR